MRVLAHFLVLVPFFMHELAHAQSCGDIVGERPTSSAARACAMNESEKAEKNLKVVERQIEIALSGETGLSLTKEQFKKAQKDWEAYRTSNCGLESFQAGEPTAMQFACEARTTTCRTDGLKKFLQMIQGETSDFSLTEICQ